MLTVVRRAAARGRALLRSGPSATSLAWLAAAGVLAVVAVVVWGGEFGGLARAAAVALAVHGLHGLMAVRWPSRMPWFRGGLFCLGTALAVGWLRLDVAWMHDGSIVLLIYFFATAPSAPCSPPRVEEQEERLARLREHEARLKRERPQDYPLAPSVREEP